MQPTLRLIQAEESSATGASGASRSVSETERQVVAERLGRFLSAGPDRHRGQTLRILDLSPIALSISPALARNGHAVRVTRLAESEVAGELIRDADPEAEVLVSTLDQLQSVTLPEAFDVVHTALVIGSRRELPLMTALAQLGRLAESGFVWTDRVKQHHTLKPKRVRDLARRVDLGFCAPKKPIGSALFTLSGWRASL